jgi:hypothetical protein
MLSPYLVSKYQHHGHVIMDADSIVTGIRREASSVDYQDSLIRILKSQGNSSRGSHASVHWGKRKIRQYCLKGQGRFGGWSTRQPGRLLLLVQPGRRADVSTPAQRLIQTDHLQRRGMADEYLAREIDTQAAML